MLFSKKGNKLSAKSFKVFVGQCVDKTNNNAQVLSVRALLARFGNMDIEWIAPYGIEPDPALVGRSNVRLIKLWPWRFWKYHKFLLYQMNVDAVLYPNAYWFDDLALQLRRISGRKIKVITALEGLGGNDDRQSTLSDWAGHQVYCQHLPDSLLHRIDRVHGNADHIIAITPFLAEMGRRLYGDKISVLPLGVETRTFFPPESKKSDRFRVIGAGRLYANKQPELFIEMAEAFPQADFVWYGEGELHEELLGEKARRGLENVSFPGSVINSRLAEEMRNSDLFVLPSLSEGFSKVSQEATACGLPVVIFGFFRSPAVVNEFNGYVVWSNQELMARVGELISAPAKTRLMGAQGAEMAKDWEWDTVAARWERKLLEILNRE